eukprot:COSAG02_NODE_1801_length_10895_cov_4.369767_2_plen_223_part_00
MRCSTRRPPLHTTASSTIVTRSSTSSRCATQALRRARRPACFAFAAAHTSGSCDLAMHAAYRWQSALVRRPSLTSSRHVTRHARVLTCACDLAVAQMQHAQAKEHQQQERTVRALLACLHTCADFRRYRRLDRRTRPRYTRTSSTKRSRSAKACRWCAPLQPPRPVEARHNRPGIPVGCRTSSSCKRRSRTPATKPSPFKISVCLTCSSMTTRLTHRPALVS